MSVSWVTVAGVGVLAGLVALMLLAIHEMKAFLARTPAIETEADLDEFKRLAARDMWRALTMLAAAVATTGLITTAAALDWMAAWEAIGVMAAWGVVLTPLGIFGRRVEAEVKGLPVADEELRAERDRVVKVWMTRPFPDWE